MRALFFVLTGILLVGCASSRIKPKLPPIEKCNEDATIYDQDSQYELNSLKSLTNLSYSTTYTRFSTATDSLEKNEIRIKLANTSQLVVLKVFPNIKLTNSAELLSKSYNTIVPATIRIKRGEPTETDFQKLIIPNDETDLQLFVELQCFSGDGIFVNYVSIFVFDTKNKELKYYDFIKYECDPRDEIMFMKTLYYGMNKLKNSIN